MRTSSHSKHLSFSTGIGASTILIIFVILCLVSFAALSIVTANADYKLSQKVLNRNTSYYQACNEAEASLAQLDQTLVDAYKNSSNETEYFEQTGHTKNYSIPLSDLQTLEITVSINYPTSSDETFYHISSWQVVTTENLEYDNTLNIMQ